MLDRWRAFRRQETGNVAIAFAISLLLLLGVAAVVIDLGHARVVKRELQKAAEAGALAGARALCLNAGGAVNNQASLTWSTGKTTAATAVQKNYADGVILSDFNITSTVTNPDGTATTVYNVEAGYWDSRWTMATAPADLNGYSNPGNYTLGTNGGPPNYTYEYPAVKVTIAKATGGTGTGAALATFFGSIFGVNTIAMKSSAVAVIRAPSKITPGGMFPFAIPKSFVDQHWADNPPTSFSVGSVQHDSSGGQWSTFKDGQVGAAIVSGFVTNGNDVPISINDNIYIDSGEAGSVYNTVVDQLAAYPNKVYMVAVVDTGQTNGVANPITTGANSKVYSFVPFQITACSGSGSNPYVTGHFVPGYISPEAAGGTGNITGDPLPPVLVQ